MSGKTDRKENMKKGGSASAKSRKANPKLKSKKVDGLYFTGQLTVPGPGVPPSLISGKLVAELIEKNEV